VTSSYLLKGEKSALAELRGEEPAVPAPGLIEILTSSVSSLLTAPSLTAALPEVLPRVAQLVPLDRVVVTRIQRDAGARAPTPLFRWSASGLGSAPPVRSVFEHGVGDAGFQEWIVPLSCGRSVAATRTNAPESLRAFLSRAGLMGLLIVPVMTDDRPWGHVGFESALLDYDWSDEDIGLLTMLAAVIGAALTREECAQALARADRVIQHSPTVLFRLGPDPALPLVYISANTGLLGHEGEALMRTPTRYRDYIHVDDRDGVQRAFARLLEPEASAATVEFRWLTDVGTIRWLESRCAALRDRGALLGIEGILTDITERKTAQEQIAQLARTDALTGVANRITFTERLRQAFAASQRGAHPFAVLYLDLDRFKEVNDSLGHRAGDLLLQQVAQRIQAVTRRIDAVARLGGDEFAIVQSELTDSAAAGALAEKLIETLSAPYFVEGTELRVGASIGISLYGAEVLSPDALLAQADQALYRAKYGGRGRYRFYSEQIDREARAHLALAEDLRGALAREELEIYYQPQVELASGRIVGMEALLRWNHPVRGVVLPEDFLPIAEKFGVMRQVGRWVLNEVCREMARWRAQRLPVPVVVINVALAQIRMGAEFVRDVMESVARWSIKPADLEFDVTERVLARATLAQSNVLEELRRHGIGIAIDDFGAQYSSLDYLRSYRVNRLKIARGMIAAADAERDGGAMVRAILSLARELGVDVVAEGVETEAQRRLLVEASAHAQGQGFYYSRAVSADEAVSLLRAGVMRPAKEQGTHSGEHHEEN
jgi:diguanylate cyclase (GGDEF)-like protein/PAS domain S-box-containing protein